mgnify:CR=1 FL=1
MVINEVFVGAGTSATLVPEMDMFFNEADVQAGLKSAIIAETAEIQLLNNLYTGCRVKCVSNAGTPLTTYTTVESNTRTTFVFTDAIAALATETIDITLYAFGAPVVGPKSGDVPQLLSDSWLGLVNTITPPNVEVEMKQMNLVH